MGISSITSIPNQKVVSNRSNKIKEVDCEHCGLTCFGEAIKFQNKSFCCVGCKSVFELLSENGLENYYELTESPGSSQEQQIINDDYRFLDLEETRSELVNFDDDRICVVQFDVPAIHCISCLWLLENLFKIHPGILQSRVNFSSKKVKITFEKETILLSELVTLLIKIGYAPKLQYKKEVVDQSKKEKKEELLKLGVAGFCFGNVMIFSTAEYFGGGQVPGKFIVFFSYLSLLLSMPVLTYSAKSWFLNSYLSLAHKKISFDVPIALGLMALASRSFYDTVFLNGSGYWDSLCGFVFFLLLGQYFQTKSFDKIKFDRDYKSYFPLSVLVEDDLRQRKHKAIKDIVEGDELFIRNNEIIPVDAEIIEGDLQLDYSFVTGESDIIKKQKGDSVLAGGKIIGKGVLLKAKKNVDQSYIVNLWSDESVGSSKLKLLDQFSPIFTISVISLGIICFLIWWLYLGDPSQGLYSMSSVYIIACPCAIGLSAPCVYGFFIRNLSAKGIYLKDGSQLSELSKVNHFIFDKTGTLTRPYMGLKKVWGDLSQMDSDMIVSVVQNSVHPVSVGLLHHIEDGEKRYRFDIEEIAGDGIIGKINNVNVRIGRLDWLINANDSLPFEVDDSLAYVGVEINDELKAIWEQHNVFRDNWDENLTYLSKNVKLSLLSGDKPSSVVESKQFFEKYLFRLNPFQKKDYIKDLQQKSDVVCMIGDGLNDAGALKQSDLGIAIVEENGYFSPSSDIVILGDSFKFLSRLQLLSRKPDFLIKFIISISLIYNIIGISFAFAGLITPLFAAILMPLSSLTVLLISKAGTSFFLREWE